MLDATKELMEIIRIISIRGSRITLRQNKKRTVVKKIKYNNTNTYYIEKSGFFYFYNNSRLKAQEKEEAETQLCSFALFLYLGLQYVFSGFI